MFLTIKLTAPRIKTLNLLTLPTNLTPGRIFGHVSFNHGMWLGLQLILRARVILPWHLLPMGTHTFMSFLRLLLSIFFSGISWSLLHFGRGYVYPQQAWSDCVLTAGCTCYLWCPGQGCSKWSRCSSRLLCIKHFSSSFLAQGLLEQWSLGQERSKNFNVDVHTDGW